MNELFNDKHQLSKIKETILKLHNDYMLVEDPLSAIMFVNKYMQSQLFPLLRYYIFDAVEYCKKRDKMNIEIQEIVDEEINKLTLELKNTNSIDCYITTKSSFTAGLNLIDGSDVDIFICIKDFYVNGEDNQIKLETVKQHLLKLGYMYDSSFGYERDWPLPTNRYISYSKIINNIEFEVKIRDWTNSIPIILLHNKMDNYMTEEQRQLYTYTKYLLKGTIYLRLLKLLIYTEHFHDIEGAFKLV